MARTAGGLRPRTFTGRLMLWNAVAVLGVLLALSVVVDRVLEHYFVGQLTDALVADARAVQEALPGTGDVQAETIRLGRALGARVTVIRTDGVVLADSEANPATTANHRTRPEVVQALQGRIGEASRVSATVGISFRYVALPPSHGRIVRVALPLTTVRSRLTRIRWILSVGFGLAALAGLAVLYVVTRRVARPLRRIAAAIEQPGHGELPAAIPQEGTGEVRLLARALEQSRADVAARLRALEEERTAREAILSSLDEGVVLFERDGTVLYQNRQAETLLGGPVAHLRNVAAPAIREAVARAEGNGGSAAAEVALGPSSRTVRVAAGAVPGDDRVLMVLRDVTEARVVDAVRRDFVANASHELKTPVASIRALAETIVTASEHDAPAVPRFAVKIERESVRLARIVADLLDLSRLEGVASENAAVRLDQVVAQETSRFEERAREADIELRVEVPGPVAVEGSDRDLALLVRNLVENAVQYTKPGGSVVVSARAEGGGAVLEVRDTGIGIPARDRRRIFERFYRVDRARSRETGGTGLGLAIVKHVAENMGGTVSIESELGRGSTFTVRLPPAH
jgi:two-component system phosphate regulon sensor histidine kinase PhoR